MKLGAFGGMGMLFAIEHWVKMINQLFNQ